MDTNEWNNKNNNSALSRKGIPTLATTRMSLEDTQHVQEARHKRTNTV
jgi:hypothetical protein